MGYRRKVVYVLGAGFSAPLGLPTISNFIEKAIQLSKSGSESVEVNRFLDRRRIVDPIMKYYDINAYDIEELLSILEMKGLLERASDDDHKAFVDGIKHVIRSYTPDIMIPDRNLPGNFQAGIFGHDNWKYYGLFVVNLFCVGLRQTSEPNKLETFGIESPPCEYAIVSLNYDLVLETAAEHLQAHWLKSGCELLFKRRIGAAESGPYLSKLHGSVEEEVISLPTWNKRMPEAIRDSWIVANSVLGCADEIRFIGYSLPVADSYIRYLLKAAALNASDPLSIDILCFDDKNGSVEERYRTLFNEKSVKFRFESADILDYLRKLWESSDGRFFKWDGLESAHRSFFADE